MKALDIVSKASDFESLKQADIDENIITNINSRHYPVHEFNKLNRENSFNIFHTNINGLENLFDLLHNLINSTELDVDLITTSETSQKEKHNFNINIALRDTGFHSTLDHKTSSGGVAIYTKNDLSVFERDDLKVMDVNFGGMDEVEKGKNICGYVYQHPSSDITEFINYISKCLTKTRNVTLQETSMLTFRNMTLPPNIRSF